MPALHEIQRTDRHIVTQVVKTELIIRSERDIAGVCFAAFVAVRFVAVDAIDTQAQELIQRTIPLAVTFGEVVVDGHYVNSFVRQRVQVYRQRCY